MENKKQTSQSDENKKILGLAIAILIIILGIFVIVKLLDGGFSGGKVSTVKETLENKDTTVIFVENSDSKKCKKCKEMKKFMDDQKIDYALYDVKEHNNTEYKEMLQSLSINPSDFNYPAVIYVKDGIMYSNIINVDNTDVIEQFIKDYELKK